MRTVTVRHSRYCAHPDENRSTEGICKCGHPRCLHGRRSAYDYLIRRRNYSPPPDGQCRAAACVDGAKCERYRPDEATLAIKEWYDRVLRWSSEELQQGRA